MRQTEKLSKALESKFRETDDLRLSENARVQRVVFLTSAVCAGIALQPLPFADILVHTPVQAYMAMKIGDIKGFPISKKQAEDILKELAGMVGLGLLAQHGIAGLYRLGLPAVGGLMAAPLMFASTYAMGRIAEYYFDQRRAGRPILVDDVKSIWTRALSEGCRRAERFLGKEQRYTRPSSFAYAFNNQRFIAPKSRVVLYPDKQYAPGTVIRHAKCPGCAQEYAIPRGLVGQDLRCSVCRTVFSLHLKGTEQLSNEG
ncbi:MAG TPA: DUF697 domain-containing protein [Firmicutes bacterium]|jgi:uncharacterized protein (DUF697 family)|nr:DUF697 domain-containing protein [Bacillota bacterium]